MAGNRSPFEQRAASGIFSNASAKEGRRSQAFDYFRVARKTPEIGLVRF
jgi:hypothetical protein